MTSEVLTGMSIMRTFFVLYLSRSLLRLSFKRRGANELRGRTGLDNLWPNDAHWTLRIRARGAAGNICSPNRGMSASHAAARASQADVAVLTLIAQGALRIFTGQPRGQPFVADAHVDQGIRGGGRRRAITTSGAAGGPTRSSVSAVAAGTAVTLPRGLLFART